MDRDSFIITVYCLVVEFYTMVKDQHRIRRGGFPPALTDEEVITMEICGAYFKLHQDNDLFAYFQQHYIKFFPALSDRPSFVRQAASLWHVKTAVWRLLVSGSGEAQNPVQVIDTLPLPVCTYTRARRDRCFKTFADHGHCAAKKLDYYGFKLGLRVSASGMITHFPLLSARAHDVNLREDHPRALQKYCSRIRKIVETVGSHLTEHFAIAHIRVHDIWHFQHRLIRKVLAHTVIVFLNLQLGRDPLDLDGLVTV